MEPDLIAAIAACSLGGLVAAFRYWTAERRRRAGLALYGRLRGIARQYGLNYEHSQLTGRFRDCALAVHVAYDTLAVAIETEDGLPPGLSLKPLGVLAETPAAPIGDPVLDEHVAISGAQTETLVALTPAARTLVAGAIDQGWSLGGQRLHGGSTWDTVLTVGLEAARALTLCHRQLTRNLVARVHDDPLPAIRRHALRILWNRRRLGRAHVDVWAAASARGLQDPDEETRFRAAELAHDEPTLVKLAAAGHVRALQCLVVEAEHEKAARGVLGTWIARQLADTTERKLALVAALTRLPVTGAEGALLTLLAAASDGGVEMAATELLAAIGTVAAVPALIPLRENAEGLPLRRAAAQAITAIQARAQGAEAGALALADATGGELALSAHEEP